MSDTRIGAPLHEVAASRVREVGQRYTAQRRRIVEILARAGSPLSIPQILRSRRDLPQSSAYRNLAGLEQAGVVRRVLTDEDFARYELNEDLTGHHHHLLCSRCGRAEDLILTTDLEETLDRVLDRLARRAGFAGIRHRLDLIGICESCARSEPRP